METSEEILEGNKLIARFVGFTYEEDIGWCDSKMNMPEIQKFLTKINKEY